MRTEGYSAESVTVSEKNKICIVGVRFFGVFIYDIDNELEPILMTSYKTGGGE